MKNTSACAPLAALLMFVAGCAGESADTSASTGADAAIAPAAPPPTPAAGKAARRIPPTRGQLMEP